MMNSAPIAHFASRPAHAVTPTQRQQGFSLLIGLIFLVILTLLGLSGATLTNMDEHMARNTRDRVLAFQAAEAAIRDAHDDINNVMKSPNRLIMSTGQTFAAANCSSSAAYVGVCLPATTGFQSWELYLDGANAASVPYLSITDPSHTSHQPFPVATGQAGSVAAPPRYLIDVLNYSSPNASLSARNGIVYVYRITAVGYGYDSSTRVVLQEVYKPV